MGTGGLSALPLSSVPWKRAGLAPPAKGRDQPCVGERKGKKLWVKCGNR